jgi:hypothetical protein
MKKLIISIIIIALLIFLGFELNLLYKNWPRESKELKIQSNSIEENQSSKKESQLTYFSQNLRFNHNNISYNIDSACSLEKRNRMIEAFSVLSRETQIISFNEADKNSDILVSCSDAEIQNDENLFISGEGGPSKYINNTIYPVILKGRIFLYKESNCGSPIVEVHELLHVFGFDHSKDKSDIMYPKSDCTQELKIAYFEELKRLYSIKPLAELYFKEADNITKAGIYLNFALTILNKGILPAKSVNLSVYADNKKVKSFELGDMKIGEGQKLTIKNLQLPSLNTKEVSLKIESQSEEYDYENNVLRAS